jgi:hypothetical protein
MGHRLGGFLEGIADRALEVGMHFGKIAGLGAIGLAAYGVEHLNNQLEQTKISLGAIATAQGFADTFEKGFHLAGDQLAKMKQDVKTLPGDLGQLSDIMKMIATPAAHGGANLDQIRKLAGQTMLTSTILGVPQDVAAREMAGLLSGRAGSHNILGGRLGLLGEEAQKFNKLSPENRLARINEEIAKYSGAADRFGTSFVAQWTTLKDNVKYGMVAEGTDALFGRVKNSMAELNRYLDEHKDRIWATANLVGNRLASAWERVESVVIRVAPVIGRIANDINLMSFADIGAKAGHLAEIGLAAKVLGPAISGAGSAVGSIARSVGPFLGSVGGEAAGGSALGGVLGAAALPVTIVAVGAAAVATMAAFGEAHALLDKSSPYHKDAERAAANLAKGLGELGEATKPAVGWFDKLGVAITDFTGTLLRGGVEFFQGWHAVAHKYIAPIVEMTPALPADKGFGPLAALGLIGIGEGGDQALWDRIGAAGAAAKHKVAPKDVHLHVGNIVIEVKGSDDPSRVARITVDTLKNWARNPTRSPGVPNYESARHT